MSKIVAVKRTTVNGELFSVDVLKSDGSKYRNLYAVDGIHNKVAQFAFCGKMTYFGKESDGYGEYVIYTEDGKLYCDAFNKPVWELFDD